MKGNVKEGLRAALTGGCVGMFALVWWGVFYPELCFPKDTYEVVYEWEEREADEADEADEMDAEICDGLLQADGEQIIVKSRLLEVLRRYKK